MNLVDSHVHLDDPQYANDLPKVLQRARDTGVTRMMTVGTDLESCARAIEIAERYEGISAAAGCHPHEADRYMGTDWFDRLKKFAQHPKVAAIGETGLDSFKKLSSLENQEKLFLGHLQIALEVNKPIVIHCRDSHDRCIEILKAEMPRPFRGIVHCFSADAEQGKKYLDMGMLISIAGPVTYPNAQRLRDVVKTLPADRVIVETDGPYLAPQIHRGGRNEPAYVIHTAETVAQLLGKSPDDFAAMSTQNVLKYLSLPL